MPRRFLVAGIALVLALASCSIRNAPSQPTPGATVPNAGGTAGPGGTGTPGSAGSGGGSTLPGSTLPGSSFADAGPVGGMARSYLQRARATKLVVEVDWVAGRKPSSTALGHLATILRRECDKPAGVTVVYGNEIQSSKSAYTIADLNALEQANRGAHSAGTTATMWIVFLNGSLAGSEGALGVSYSASSAGIFRDRIDSATTALILASEIEASVVTHEAGHLLALVNIGYTSRFAHEDGAHPHHSNSRSSVMYWAVEDISIRNLLTGGPPDDFDDADRADLEMLRNS